ncbi:MAG: methyltransferase domain-containing protein [Bacteroidota bacterium]|nr:methyltransferase domain-containing protein [Bacteroidota bacterium]
MSNKSNVLVQKLESMDLLEKKAFRNSWFNSDEQFHQLYSPDIQLLARRHWTPLNVARTAAAFLAAESNVRVLDIGSGVGKFCLGAAYYKPDAIYYGVEQRKRLVTFAETVRNSLSLENVFFIHGNFTQIDLRKYDHFYFYNSFYENLAGTDKIDDTIDYSGELYNYYNRYLYKQLDQVPVGSRLATFHSLDDEGPQSFHIVGSAMDNLLKFWIKV